ncbi:LytTR family DNA-binding domain-containing protein [Rhodobacter maris]|nr:LytTR family DNA-binding domain-containing protein [Rhodobacter maris]
MKAFFRSYLKALGLPIVPIAWVLISILGVAGAPFGTSGLSLFNRILLWPALVAAGIMVGTALRVLVRDYLGFRRYWPEVPLIAVLSAVVLAPFFHLLARLTGAPLRSVPGLIELAVNIFVVSMVFSSFRHLLGEKFEPVRPEWHSSAGPASVETTLDAVSALATGQLAAVPEAEPEVRLLARLSATRRGALIRLEVKDHYVKVFTTLGNESLLMRLADAMAETEGVEGLQVHRSHWVAREAIFGLSRERGKYALMLYDGTQIPVSRSHAPRVLALDLPELRDGA